jgi:hypothetical protein
MQILKNTLAIIFFGIGVLFLFLAWQNQQIYRAGALVGTILLFGTLLLLHRPAK